MKRPMFFGRTMALIVAVGGALLSAPARAQYTFTPIATAGNLIGPYNSFSPGPAISDRGTMAFIAGLRGGGVGIFTGTGGPATTMLDSSGPINGFNFAGNPAINRHDTVASSAILDPGGFGAPQGIFTGNGAATTTIVTSDRLVNFLGEPAINAAGTVAFRAGDGQSIVTSNGGALATLYDTSGSFSYFGQFVSLNDAGTAAFIAGLRGGDSAIFTGSGGDTTLIAPISGAFGSSANSFPTINNAGTVAFITTLDGVQGVFTGSGGALTTVADRSGPFSDFNLGSDIAPAINDMGTVAFRARLDDGGVGIFTGPDPLRDKVIALGEELDGSTVTSLGFSRFGLNNSGQITFYAQLAGNRIGIYRADPVAIPEPGTLVLLLGGSVASLGFWRRRRR